MTSKKFRLAAAAIGAAAITAVPALAGTMHNNSYDFIHKQMAQTTPEARSVGSITVAWDIDDPSEGNIARGSGVLVGGRYVLTAAHLVDNALGGQFHINGQNYNMRSWVVANEFYARGIDDDPNPDQRVYGNGADLALVLLDRRVEGAGNLKAKINRNRNEAGQTATIVGFGRGGSGSLGINVQGSLSPTLPGDGSLGTSVEGTWDYQPVKRAGKNKIEVNGPFSPTFSNNRELVTDFDPNPSILGSLTGLNPPQFDPFTGEYDLDEDDIPIQGEYMPSVGDSGGGLFINGKLAGIASWTTRANSEYFSQAHYSRLSVKWWRWIRHNKRAYNDLVKNGPAARPWNKRDNGGNGFRGVAKIQAEAEVTDDGGAVLIYENQVINIFGPGLFYKEDGTQFEVTAQLDTFIANDLNANPAPLPEPASLALLSLGSLAALRRARR